MRRFLKLFSVFIVLASGVSTYGQSGVQHRDIAIQNVSLQGELLFPIQSYLKAIPGGCYNGYVHCKRNGVTLFTSVS